MDISAFLIEYLSEELVVFVIAMLPFFELKMAIPLGVSLGLSVRASFLYSYLGSMIPAILIIYFIRKIFNYLRSIGIFRGTIKKLIQKSNLKYEKLIKYKMLGLFLFVAIPLPGTGVWSASLISDVVNLNKKASLIIIAVGNFIAGLIVLILSHLIIN